MRWRRYLQRRGWDSNPRALADKRFSRPPRYDHFDTSPCRTLFGSAMIILANQFERVNTFFLFLISFFLISFYFCHSAKLNSYLLMEKGIPNTVKHPDDMINNLRQIITYSCTLIVNRGVALSGKCSISDSENGSFMTQPVRSYKPASSGALISSIPL